MTHTITAHELSQVQSDAVRLGKKYANKIGRICDREDTAQELAQEALRTALEKLPLYDPAKSSARTYLYAVMRNRITNYIQREKPIVTQPSTARKTPGVVSLSKVPVGAMPALRTYIEKDQETAERDSVSILSQMMEVASTVKHGDTVIRLMLGLVTAKEAMVATHLSRSRVYQIADKLRATMAQNERLQRSYAAL